MANNVTIDYLKNKLSNDKWTQNDSFMILKGIASVVNDPEREVVARELIIRALEYRENLSPQNIILLDTLTRHIGLFPYVDAKNLSIADQLAYEFHRPLNMQEDIVLHSDQANAYHELLNRRNLILSAPTSFGKSLLIDAMIATNMYSNIAIVVPTIALIDETRRRLLRFRNHYNIITHINQKKGERNIFIMTQERIISYGDLGKIDFFVIDEFYKLHPEPDPARAYILNQSFYKLYKTGAQFYLLGPNIENIPSEASSKFKCTFIRSDFNTVVSEIYYIKPLPSPQEATFLLCKKLSSSTLIFCKSPGSLRKLTEYLISAGLRSNNNRLREAVEWLSYEYHPDWLLVRALLSGIGIHHARLPRSIAQFVIRAFNEGYLQYLLCTSTIIEGVNTSAKNVIVYDNKIARKNLDFFTFNNIRGRSGRMFRHYIGHVYIMNEPPYPQLPFVDFPAFTQGADTPNELLIQLDWEDLSDLSKSKVDQIYRQDILEIESIRENVGIDVDMQIRLAEELNHNPLSYLDLAWTNYPTSSQLRFTCEIIWNSLGANKHKAGGIFSEAQLAYKIGKLCEVKDIKRLIELDISKGDSPNDAIENTLDFLRQWANFHFPRYLMALHRIQNAVFNKHHLPPGNYKLFSDQVENLFMPPAFIALEEYGIPYQVTRKIVNALGPLDDLNSVLDHLKLLTKLEKYGITEFEKSLINDVQNSI